MRNDLATLRTSEWGLCPTMCATSAAEPVAPFCTAKKSTTVRCPNEKHRMWSMARTVTIPPILFHESSPILVFLLSITVCQLLYSCLSQYLFIFFLQVWMPLVSCPLFNNHESKRLLASSSTINCSLFWHFFFFLFRDPSQWAGQTWLTVRCLLYSLPFPSIPELKIEVVVTFNQLLFNCFLHVDKTVLADRCHRYIPL